MIPDERQMKVWVCPTCGQWGKDQFGRHCVGDSEISRPAGFNPVISTLSVDQPDDACFLSLRAVSQHTVEGVTYERTVWEHETCDETPVLIEIGPLWRRAQAVANDHSA